MRSAEFSAQFLDSYCEGSSSSSEIDFHMPGRLRKNGWRCRTTSYSAEPPRLDRTSNCMRTEFGGPQCEPKLLQTERTIAMPRSSVIPASSALQSQNSAMEFYSFLMSNSFADSSCGRRADRAFTGSWVPEPARFSPDSQSPMPESPVLTQPPKRTVYTAGTSNFSAGELSVVVDAHHVVHTTHVTVSKRGGQCVVNDYVEIKELGSGSYGKVKLVKHLVTSELYAMKIVEPFSGNTALMQKRVQSMRREVAVMKRMCHPHMVKLHEVLSDMHKGRLYMVMQYINGGSIAKKVTDWTIEPIPEELLRKQARQLLSALKYMQMNGVVHRDIKPDNILVDDMQNAYLADFGMSAICTEGGVAGVEGTPAFMAPELCRGESAVCGDLVDIWALGISLFQLMYGRLPFTAPTQLKLTTAILTDSLRFPDEDLEDSACQRGPSPSPDFKELIRGMLEKDPERRWNTRKAVDCAWFASAPFETPQLDCLCIDANDSSGSFTVAGSQLLSVVEDATIEDVLSTISVRGPDH